MTIDAAERLVYALEDLMDAVAAAHSAQWVDDAALSHRDRCRAVLVTMLAGPQPALPSTPDDIGRPL